VCENGGGGELENYFLLNFAVNLKFPFLKSVFFLKKVSGWLSGLKVPDSKSVFKKKEKLKTVACVEGFLFLSLLSRPPQ
jgi:hypothetical protein